MNDSCIKRSCFKCKEAEVISKITDYIFNGYYLALYTDKVVVGEISENSDCTPAIEDITHLTELRVFNDRSEVKASRSNIEKDFTCRVVDDSETTDAMKELYTYNEIQYLDIDDRKSYKRIVGEMSDRVELFTTGGGRYELPASLAGCDRVMIRNYIEYTENTGNAMIVDWRIVKFVDGGER